MSEQSMRRRRLRRLAERALAAYDLAGARLTPLGDWDNTVFRVEASQLHEPDGGRDTTGGELCYALRLHHPCNQNILPPAELARLRAGAPDLPTATRPHGSVEMLRSELLWLVALRREAGLGVPDPVPAHDGGLVPDLSGVADAEPRHCVLFRWVEGRFGQQNPRPVELERVGGFLARLHEHSARFRPPAGFVRQRWDWTGRFDATMALSWRRQPELVPAEDAAMLDRALAHIQVAMRALRQAPDRYGLIHADLGPANVLFHRGEVRAIDFDDCGWGHYLYDLAVPLSYWDDRPDFSALQAALLRGYRRLRSLSSDDEAELPTFLAARRLALTSWVLERAAHPAVREGAAWFVPRSAGEVCRYLGW